jgi:hypothetical protein
MAQRGRKSTASLSVIQGSIDRRPSPPIELTDEEAEVWERTVSGEAADVFGTPATQQMLKDYCRHVVAAERLGLVIESHMQTTESDVSLKDLDRLLKMRDRETKAIADKATKLRLTNQSRYTPDRASTAAKNNLKADKPWQMTG